MRIRVTDETISFYPGSTFTVPGANSGLWTGGPSGNPNANQNTAPGTGVGAGSHGDAAGGACLADADPDSVGATDRYADPGATDRHTRARTHSNRYTSAADRYARAASTAHLYPGPPSPADGAPGSSPADGTPPQPGA